MAQKILAGRCADPSLAGDVALAKVDQIVLARAPERVLAEALAQGLKRTHVEVAVAYDGLCVTPGLGAPTAARTLPDALSYGLLLGRAGAGFPLAVHLERFASPGRLCVSDEPRLSGLGGSGMLSLTLAPAAVAAALVTGTVALRPPRSVQVLVSGRLRPFVAARDVALELLRRGLAEKVRRIDEETGAPVVVEFAGPSVRLLSVTERAVLAGIAPALGAAAVLFVSDERTEVFLRDERRSKAHRPLAPDAGAPFDDVLSIDLGAVDPLLWDEAGVVRPVRELAGKPVSQVLLGGDGGLTLRDLLATAALLKSKRVPPRLDLLVAPPSRQALEVLATEGALADLAAAGARFVEPDRRLLTQGLYAPGEGGVAVRTCDAEPAPPGRPLPIVASAETAAYAVAHGEVGDPRSFKRPVRVTVPRTLPTDDVLLVRERRESKAAKPTKPEAKASVEAPRPTPAPFRGSVTLPLRTAAAWLNAGASAGEARAASGAPDESAVLVRDLAELRAVLAVEGPVPRAVVATFLPAAAVAQLSALGSLALHVSVEAFTQLGSQATVAIPALGAGVGEELRLGKGEGAIVARWAARSHERAWVESGFPRTSARTKA